MTAGFFSPLPPARTGVADYSAALLPALRQCGPVEVNGEDADVCLYHVGNNGLHREIYERALRRPGVVVIHDAVLHHFHLGALTEEQYTAEFVYNYGPWSRDLARTLWRERAQSAADPRYFRFPMLKRIAETSRAVIVHNPGAAALVRAHAPAARIHEIPHLFTPGIAAPAYEVERLRAGLGCAGNVLLCGVFGHLRESKRLAAVFRAVRRIGPERVRLLVAGEFASSGLARALEPELARNGVIRRSYLPEKEFWLHAAAVDVCLNPRYPAAGETSGIAIRLMGIGKPVVLTAGLETSRFPAGTCVFTEAGETEEDALVALLLWLADHRGDTREIGRRAADFIASEHALPRVADLYWNVLRDCYDGRQLS